MKKLFGIRMNYIQDIIASLPILDLLEDEIGKTYNIFSIAKSCQEIIPIIKNHSKIQQIKISDYENNLGKTDFEAIKSCDYYINPSPIHPKEKDWYNFRSLIQETCFMAGLDYRLIKTLPYIDYKPKKLKSINKSIFIIPSYLDKEINKRFGPDDLWWNNILNNKFFNNIKIYSTELLNIKRDYQCIDNKYSFEEKINIALGSNLILAVPSDLSWTASAINSTPQINILSNERPGHIKNYEAFAPIGEKVKNIFSPFSCNEIDRQRLFELISKEL